MLAHLGAEQVILDPSLARECCEEPLVNETCGSHSTTPLASDCQALTSCLSGLTASA